MSAPEDRLAASSDRLASQAHGLEAEVASLRASNARLEEVNAMLATLPGKIRRAQIIAAAVGALVATLACHFGRFLGS